MATSRKKQNRDITRIVGILFLEVLAAMALLSLAGFAHQQRTGEKTTPQIPRLNTADSAATLGGVTREFYPYPDSLVWPTYVPEFVPEKSLPRIDFGRYNSR